MAYLRDGNRGLSFPQIAKGPLGRTRCSLGTSWETDKNVHDLIFYDPVPTEMAANDDLDFQLVRLKMLQERGLYPSLGDFADYWIKHLGPSAAPGFPYGENVERCPHCHARLESCLCAEGE